MTNVVAIEELRYQKKMSCFGVNYQAKIEAIDMAISALEKQEGKKPIGIKVEGKDPYTEVAKLLTIGAGGITTEAPSLHCLLIGV